MIQLALRGFDLLAGVGAFFLAYIIRAMDPAAGLGPWEGYSWMLGASLTLRVVLYAYMGFYRSLRMRSYASVASMVVRALVAELLVLGALVFLLQAKTTSRHFFALFLGINYGAILLVRMGAKVALSAIRRRGYNFRQVLILGTGKNASDVIDILRRNSHWGFVPCGVLRDPESAQVDAVSGVPVIGVYSDLESVVRTRAVDEVYFAGERLDPTEMATEIGLCEKAGLSLHFSFGMLDLRDSRVAFRHLEHLPVVTYYTTMHTLGEALFKRTIDVALALVGLAITAVLSPWIAWRIRQESPGPVIFKQKRVGENGRTFSCYKFRTMYVGADAERQRLWNTNQMQGPIFKVENDPRITPFGAFLRRTSLDELPQFFNILRGDMSVVGTRPPTLDEVDRYQFHFRRRLSIRPGLTGLWQVSGRSQVKRFEDILELDLTYIDRWSLWLDFQIIAKTVWVVLVGRGAH